MSQEVRLEATNRKPADLFQRLAVWTISRLLRGRKIVLSSVLLALVIGIFRMHFVEPYYDATAVLAPGGSSPQNPTSSTLSTLSSLTGMSSSATKLSPYEQFMQVLSSNQLAKALSSDDELMTLLFPDLRDASTHQWKENRSSINSVSEAILAWFNWPAPGNPDSVAIQNALSHRLTIQKDPKSNVAIVTFRAASSAQARRLLTKIINQSDDLVRLQFNGTSTEFSNFVIERLRSVTSLDQRASLDSLLTEYQRMEIMSGVRLPFATTIVDPPYAGTSPTGPNSLLGFVEWLVAGLFIGTGIVLFRFRADS